MVKSILFCQFSDESSVELSKPGADVELQCPLDPPVQWVKNGIILSDGPHYSINSENGTLTISKVIAGVCFFLCIFL